MSGFISDAERYAKVRLRRTHRRRPREGRTQLLNMLAGVSVGGQANQRCDELEGEREEEGRWQLIDESALSKIQISRRRLSVLTPDNT